MNGAARKPTGDRSAASKLPPGPDRERALDDAAAKMADIFLKHDLDRGLNLGQIRNNTRKIEQWADSKTTSYPARAARSKSSSVRTTRANPVKTRISA